MRWEFNWMKNFLPPHKARVKVSIMEPRNTSQDRCLKWRGVRVFGETRVLDTSKAGVNFLKLVSKCPKPHNTGLLRPL